MEKRIHDATGRLFLSLFQSSYPSFLEYPSTDTYFCRVNKSFEIIINLKGYE